MKPMEVTVETRCTAELVFDFIADLENDERWVKHWRSERRSETRELGATYARRYAFPLSPPKEATVVVTGYERPRRFAFESRTSDSLAKIEFRIEPSDRGVRVTKSEEFVAGGLMGFATRYFGFVFRREAQTVAREPEAPDGIGLTPPTRTDRTRRRPGPGEAPGRRGAWITRSGSGRSPSA